MKRILIVGILPLFLFLAANAASAQIDTRSFMGIKWGTHVSEIPRLEQIAAHYDGNVKVYARPGVPLKMGNSVFNNIKYYFWNELFLQGVVEISSVEQVENVISYLRKEVGKPSTQYDKDYKHYEWETYPVTYIILEYAGIIKSMSTLKIGSKQVYSKLIEMEKLKDEARGWIFDYLNFGYGSFSKYGLDTTTVSRLSDNIVKADMLSVSFTESLLESRITQEFNCDRREWRVISAKYYENGKPDQFMEKFKDRVGQWEKVSFTEEPYYKIACRK